MSELETIGVEQPLASPLPDERAVRVSRAILTELFGPPRERRFDVRFWNGESDTSEGPGEARFTLVLCHPGSLRRMLLPPSELAIVEAYLHADVDVEGDLEAASEIADAVVGRLRSPRKLARVLRLVLALPGAQHDDAVGRPRRGRFGRLGARHSPRRAAAAVRFHYDLSNDFFALFLDRRLLYTCGYFPTGTEDIDAAQEAKLELICRKLRLRPGERLLDIGCGWGGLVTYAAERYGASCLGITISEEQARLARERIAAAGLSDRCRVEVQDYRELPPGTQFDKLASIGMTEHIGRESLPQFFRVAHGLVRPGGLYLNQCVIKRPSTAPSTLAARLGSRLWYHGQFIGRYVFPDSKVMPAGEVILGAERAGFEVRDLENLRDHYVQTTRHWVRRLESRRAEAVALVGDATYRVFRLFMAAGARMQRTGRDGVVQMLLAKPDAEGRTGLPRTRAALYDADADAQPSAAR